MSVYKKVKGTDTWQCLTCKEIFPVRGEVAAHAKSVHPETLTAYDLHFQSKCGRDSRKCRYCHPEEELGYADVCASLMWTARSGSGGRTADAVRDERCARLSTLLSLEHRFRNKLTDAHLRELRIVDGAGQFVHSESTDVDMHHIADRLEERVRKCPNNDGLQTPYVRSAYDVLSHICATCCRGCIFRWYGYPRDAVLTDTQMQRLTATNMTLLLLLRSAPKFTAWMTARTPAEAAEDDGRYYDPSYVTVRVRRDSDCYYVKLSKLDGEYDGARTNFSKVRSKYRGKDITTEFLRLGKEMIADGTYTDYLNMETVPFCS